MARGGADKMTRRRERARQKDGGTAGEMVRGGDDEMTSEGAASETVRGGDRDSKRGDGRGNGKKGRW